MRVLAPLLLALGAVAIAHAVDPAADPADPADVHARMERAIRPSFSRPSSTRKR